MLQSTITTRIATTIPSFPHVLARCISSYLIHTPKSSIIYKFPSEGSADAQGVQQLDTAHCDAKWTPLPRMLTPRQSCSAATVNDCLYVTSDNIRDADCNMDFFDPTQNKWSRASPLRVPRYNHQSVACGGLLYVIGGNNATQKEMKSVESYNPKTETWHARFSMHTARTMFAAIECEGKIYVMGGMARGNVLLYSCECFDPRTDVWTAVAPLLNARGRATCTLVPHATRLGTWVIGLIGGVTQKSAFNTNVDMYDIENNCWSTATWTLPTPLALFSAQWISDGVVVYGGNTGLHSRNFACQVFRWTIHKWLSMCSIPHDIYL